MNYPAILRTLNKTLLIITTSALGGKFSSVCVVSKLSWDAEKFAEYWQF